MRYRAYDVILAGQVGLDAAIVHGYIDAEVKAKRMILRREEREKYLRGGRYWMIATPRQLEKELSFLSPHRVQKAIRLLLGQGLLMVETEELIITGRGQDALTWFTTQLREE